MDYTGKARKDDKTGEKDQRAENGAGKRQAPVFPLLPLF